MQRDTLIFEDRSVIDDKGFVYFSMWGNKVDHFADDLTQMANYIALPKNAVTREAAAYRLMDLYGVDNISELNQAIADQGIDDNTLTEILMLSPIQNGNGQVMGDLSLILHKLNPGKHSVINWNDNSVELVSKRTHDPHMYEHQAHMVLDCSYIN